MKSNSYYLYNYLFVNKAIRDCIGRRFLITHHTEYNYLHMLYACISLYFPSHLLQNLFQHILAGQGEL